MNDLSSGARPLLVTDCDEVLLHMVRHFADWLGDEHGIAFDLRSADFAGALTYREDGATVPPEEVWKHLSGFFVTEMGRQTLVPGALEALGTIGETADIVILTNLGDDKREGRIEQLARFGIHHRVVCNSGGKGAPLRRIVAEHGAPRHLFVDDLAVHHESVAKHSPDTHRLHMIADPVVAGVMPPAGHAHARIDDWATATPWILERLEG